MASGTAPPLPLPACHKGVYARLRRAMDRVGVRGRGHRSKTRGHAPSPAPTHPSPACGGGLGGATSPRMRGEVKAVRDAIAVPIRKPARAGWGLHQRGDTGAPIITSAIRARVAVLVS